MCYRLTITNLAINILVPSVFRHEFRSTVSNFLSWRYCFREAPFVLMMLYPESAVCSRFQQQIGIPSHVFAVIIKICCCITPSWIQRFRVSKEKQFIQELLAYAKDVTILAAKELASRINEDAVMEWLHADDNVPTIHYYTDSEIVHMVV